MSIQHSQETVIKTYNYKDIDVDLVEWEDTVWCGKISYAENNTDEPNVEKTMEDFMSCSDIPNNRENNWNVCISVNYLSDKRPNGVMFGFLVSKDDQPKQYDSYKIPSAKFLRIKLCDKTAKALGHDSWKGGIPPYDWIGGQIAPELGYTYGSDTVPIIEYYGFFNPEKGTHKYCYLYVPIKENNDTSEK